MIVHIENFRKLNPSFDVCSFDFQDQVALDNLSWPESDDNVEKESLLDQLMAMQRLFRLNLDEADVERLLDLGFDSANGITALSEQQFVDKVGQQLPGGGSATDIYHKAAGIKQQTLHMWGNAANLATATHFRKMPGNNVGEEIPEYFENIPSYADLFGNQNYQQIDASRSIFSASAYLSDLLKIIDQYVSDPNNALIPEKLKISFRRPDLTEILLDHDSTHKEVPYIEIVNDVLNGLLKNYLLAAQSENDKKDQRAVYDALETQVYPNTLPFNLSLTKTRAYLKQNKIELADIYQKCQRSDFIVVFEMLNITRADADLFFKDKTIDAATLCNGYGILVEEPTVTSLKALVKATEFSSRTNLDFKQLRQLFEQNLSKSELLAGLSAGFYINQGLKDSSPMLLDLKGSDEYIDNLLVSDGRSGKDFSDQVCMDFYHRLDRLNRFVRLSKKLDISFENLDWLFHIYAEMYRLDIQNQDCLDESFLLFLSKVKKLSELLSVSLDDTIPVIGSLKTYGGQDNTPFDDTFNRHTETPYHPVTRENLLYKDEASRWDITGVIEDSVVAQRVNNLRSALGIRNKNSEFISLASWLAIHDEVNSEKYVILDVPTLSAFYRFSRLSTLLGISIDDCTGLFDLVATTGDESSLIDQLLNAVKSARWLEQNNMSVAELKYVLSGVISEQVKASWKNQDLAEWQKNTRDVLLSGVSEGGTEQGAEESDSGTEDALKQELANFYQTTPAVISCLASWVNLDEGWHRSLLHDTPESVEPVMITLARALMLFQKLDLNESLLLSVIGHPDQYNLPADFNALSFKQLQHLCSVRVVFADFNDKENRFFEYIESKTLDNSTALELLMQASGWEKTQLEPIADLAETRFNSRIEQLKLIHGLWELAKRTDLDSHLLIKLADPTAICPDLAEQVRQSVLCRYEGHRQKEVDEQIQKTLNEKLRDVLLSIALWQIQQDFPDIDNDVDLFEYLLIDVKRHGMEKTSLVVSAYASCQLYLQRCRLGLERGIQNLTIPEPWWEWMLEYRVWEANRKVFLYPENTIEASLRKEKTDLFKKLQEELVQADLQDEEHVEKAFLNYVDQFQTLARLKIVDSCYCYAGEGDSREEKLFLFGRTIDEPYDYYYTVQNVATGIWEHWRKIDINTIQADTITPVYAFNKLFVFWVELTKQTKADSEKVGSKDRKGDQQQEKESAEQKKIRRQREKLQASLQNLQARASEKTGAEKAIFDANIKIQEAIIDGLEDALEDQKGKDAEVKKKVREKAVKQKRQVDIITSQIDIINSYTEQLNAAVKTVTGENETYVRALINSLLESQNSSLNFLSGELKKSIQGNSFTEAIDGLKNFFVGLIDQRESAIEQTDRELAEERDQKRREQLRLNRISTNLSISQYQRCLKKLNATDAGETEHQLYKISIKCSYQKSNGNWLPPQTLVKDDVVYYQHSEGDDPFVKQFNTQFGSGSAVFDMDQEYWRKVQVFNVPAQGGIGPRLSLLYGPLLNKNDLNNRHLTPNAARSDGDEDYRYFYSKLVNALSVLNLEPRLETSGDSFFRLWDFSEDDYSKKLLFQPTEMQELQQPKGTVIRKKTRISLDDLTPLAAYLVRYIVPEELKTVGLKTARKEKLSEWSDVWGPQVYTANNQDLRTVYWQRLIDKGYIADDGSILLETPQDIAIDYELESVVTALNDDSKNNVTNLLRSAFFDFIEASGNVNNSLRLRGVKYHPLVDFLSSYGPFLTPLNPVRSFDQNLNEVSLSPYGGDFSLIGYQENDCFYDLDIKDKGSRSSQDIYLGSSNALTPSLARTYGIRSQQVQRILTADGAQEYQVMPVKNLPGAFILNTGQESFLCKVKSSTKAIEDSATYKAVSVNCELNHPSTTYLYENLSGRTSKEREQRQKTTTVISALVVARRQLFDLVQFGDEEIEISRLTTMAVDDLDNRIRIGGIPRLLDVRSQQKPPVELHPFSRFNPDSSVQLPALEDGSQIDFDGVYGTYFWELFYHAPMLIIETLASQKKHEMTAKWLQYLFDPLRAGGIQDNTFNEETKGLFNPVASRLLALELKKQAVTDKEKLVSPDGAVSSFFNVSADDDVPEIIQQIRLPRYSLRNFLPNSFVALTDTAAPFDAEDSEKIYGTLIDRKRIDNISGKTTSRFDPETDIAELPLLYGDIYPMDQVLYTEVYTPDMMGVHYDYYHIPPNNNIKSDISEFDKLTPVYSGITDRLTIEDRDRNEWVAQRFMCRLKISAAGTYKFFYRADDNGKLYIDDKLVVDAPEYSQEYSAEIDLKAGDHPLTIYFIQWGGGIVFNVYYQGPDTDGKKTTIPGYRLMLPEAVPLLRYSYYTAPADTLFTNVPDFVDLLPVHSGFMPKFTLDTLPGAGPHNFAACFWGGIKITEAGNYQFFVTVDDGCTLSIDDTEIIVFDRLGYAEERGSAPISLSAGFHTIELRYFNHRIDYGLSVAYQGPDTGNEKTDIPNNVLSLPVERALLDRSYNKSAARYIGTAPSAKLIDVTAYYAGWQREHFALRFKGMLRINNSGEYHFRVNSDDGSMLFINDQLVVHNDQIHSARERNGRIKLTAGQHPVTIEFFQKDGGIHLDVVYKGADTNNQFQSIEKHIWALPETIPAVFFHRYDGAYKEIPDLSALTPSKQGVCAGLGIRHLMSETDNVADKYVAHFKTRLKIDNQGEYAFWSLSPEAFRLIINGNTLIDSKGEGEESSAKVSLSSGFHVVEVVCSHCLDDTSNNNQDDGTWNVISDFQLRYRGADTASRIQPVPATACSIPSSLYFLLKGYDIQEKAAKDNLLSESDFISAKPKAHYCTEGFVKIPKSGWNNAGYNLRGQLSIYEPGTYRFAAGQEEAARLFIDQKEVFFSLWETEPETLSKPIELDAGLHQIDLHYSQNLNPDSELTICYHGPDTDGVMRPVSPKELRLPPAAADHIHRIMTRSIGLNPVELKQVKKILLNWQVSKPSSNYWGFQPFRNHQLKTVREIFGNQAAIALNRRRPFDPHAIARLRIGAYEKAIVMKYMDNLLDKGDELFIQSTRESVNLALLYYAYVYELLGTRPRALGQLQLPPAKTYTQLKNTAGRQPEKTAGTKDSACQSSVPDFLVSMENALPEQGICQAEQSDQAADMPFVMGIDGYFMVPENDRLVKYWDKIEDRLYKIRNGLDIKGQRQILPLFEAPIDPAALVRAAASGGGLASSSRSRPEVPHYRFAYLITRAREFCNNLIQFGQGLLSVLEKADAEHLARLRVTQESGLLNLTTAMKEHQIDEQKKQLEGLNFSKESAVYRNKYYDTLIKRGWNAGEKTNVALTSASIVCQGIGTGLTALAIPGYLVPNIYGLAVGGMQFGTAIGTGGQISFALAQTLSQSAGLAATVAQYERRKEEWELQQRIAEYDVSNLEQQIAGAEARVGTAEQDLKTHQQSITYKQEEADFLKDKFTNKELYNWCVQRLSTFYYQAYNDVRNFSLSTQAAYNYELNRNDSFFEIEDWDHQHKGLLAGEGLLFNLNRMEQAYLANDVRRLEIEKTISLRQHFPREFFEFKWGDANGRKGVIEFNLNQAMFDFDYPGHYFRQIKSISVSIPAIIGPYQNLHATLVQLGNSVVLEPDTSAARHLVSRSLPDIDATDAPDTSVLRESWKSSQQIAISRGVDDSGVFNLDFNDPRYLPFENTGAVSTWQLTMPPETNRINFGNLSDIIVRVRYTALDGGEKYRKDIQGLYQGRKALQPYLHTKAIELKQAYPDQWRYIIKGEADNDKLSFVFPVTDDAVLTSMQNIDLKSVLVRLKTAGKETVQGAGFLTLTFGEGDPQKLNIRENVGEIISPAISSSCEPAYWTLTFDLKQAPKELLEADSASINEQILQDMAVILVYQTHLFG